MEEVLIWSLKVSGLLIILFLGYYILFKNNTAFQLRRFLLISLLALCSLTPLLKIEVTDAEPKIVQQAYQIRQSIVKPISSEKEVPTSPIEYKQADTSTQSTDWMAVLVKVYLLGIGLSLAIFVLELTRVFTLSISAEKDHTLGKNIFRHAYVKSPFSFGKWIFIPKLTQYSDSSWAIILRHELVHIHQKHSLDLILIRLIQSLIWYNPIIYLFQKELKAIHEAQADEEVLEQFDFKTYASTLMNVSLSSQQVQITHSFAVISSLSKRLKLMKTHKTTIRKSISLLVIFLVPTITLVGWTSLYGQEGTQKVNGEITIEQVDYKIEELMSFPVKAGIMRNLSKEHSLALERLKAENPDKSIRFKYFQGNDFSKYFDSYEPGYKPIYIDEVSEEQKLEIYELVKNDSASVNFDKDSNGKPIVTWRSYGETVPNLKELVLQTTNYLMIYEATPSKISNDVGIFEIHQVDKAPEVVGGIENLARSIALNITIPEDLDRDKLPDTVDFEFVVRGGHSISHLNLITELKGSDKKNEPYYRLFGQVHNELKAKTQTIYPWKRGIKDGKEVLVRMKISIPTKYMM